ncbi:hypothetical protein [Streptomyces clavifer]|uniref:hypothetical protein n=1 Tax=Streptomyces clavifer TaxID=68188 RepID=UPI0033B00BCE
MRALDCLLGHAVAGARTGALLPGGVLGLVAGGLATRSGDEMPATVTGVHLPAQHRHAGTFTAAHPELYALTPGRTTRPPDRPWPPSLQQQPVHVHLRHRR